MKRIFIIPLFFFLFAANFLQGQSSFSKSYYLDNGISSDVGANIQNYEDGFLLLVGRNGFGHDHVGLAKTNLSGDPEWTNIYYLENHQTPPDPGLRNDETITYPIWLIPFRSSRLSFCLNSPTIRTKRYLSEQKLIYPNGASYCFIVPKYGD